MAKTENVKVGNLEFKAYAVEKPVGFDAKGNFVTIDRISKEPSLAVAGPLNVLDEEKAVSLTLERTRLEPDFKLGIIGYGIVTKDELLEHINLKTDLGREVVQAEVNYCNELVASLAMKKSSPWPEMPKEKEPSIPDEFKALPKKWLPFFRAIALFCENTTDAVTTPAANWRIKNIHPVFVKRGFSVVALTGTNDVRPNFIPIAKNCRTRYISGIGHGSPTVYTGHLSNHILEVGAYAAKEVRNKVIHFLSCQTAKKLGPDTVMNGTKAYAGYFENFTFVWDNPATPVNEQDLFWRCDGTFDIWMATGHTAEQAVNATIAAYNAAIALVPGTAAATWLTWDRNYLRSPVTGAAYGSKTARISPLIPPCITLLEGEIDFEHIESLE